MKKRDDLHIELFDDAENKFKHHLEIKGNERIIFSGKFGHGKTTFLREFFDCGNQEDNFKKEQFEVISIFPINYAIASNEDIFKYIKYDIILEMLNKNYQVEETLISELETIPSYLNENLYKISSIIISMIPQVGKDLSDMFDKITQLIKGFKDYHVKAEDDANESNKLIEYINEIGKKEGSIFESNIVSKVIEKILRKNKGDKQSILLIDDLDRIDPEHIFRILNVFAAHFDRRHKSSKNKFGFDKIILVCDIENIRNIFKTKYGVETDFNGYIDKFYSHEIFNYSIRKSIGDLAYLKLSNAKWKSGMYHVRKEQATEKRKKYFDTGGVFADIISMLFDNRQIDLRNLIKWSNLHIDYVDCVVLKNNIPIDLEKFPIVFYVILLCRIKGSAESLKHSLINISSNKLDSKNLHSYIRDIVYIVTVPDHKMKSNLTVFHTVKDYPVRLIIGNELNMTYRDDTLKHLHFTSTHFIYAICELIDLLITENVV